MARGKIKHSKHHARGSVGTRTDAASDIFEATGEAVIDRILRQIRSEDVLGAPYRRSLGAGSDVPKSLAGLAPGSLFKGEQNASGMESKTFPVNVELKVR